MGAVIIGSGLATYAATKKVKMARSVTKHNFMAEPISSELSLSDTQCMKTRMELMIMKIQAEFCKALESEEDENTKFCS